MINKLPQRSVIGNLTVKELYNWVLDQIADFDEGVAWETLVHFGKVAVGIEKSRIDCAVGDLLNSRRIVRNRKGLLMVRD